MQASEETKKRLRDEDHQTSSGEKKKKIEKKNINLNNTNEKKDKTKNEKKIMKPGPTSQPKQKQKHQVTATIPAAPSVPAGELLPELSPQLSKDQRKDFVATYIQETLNPSVNFERTFNFSVKEKSFQLTSSATSSKTPSLLIHTEEKKKNSKETGDDGSEPNNQDEPRRLNKWKERRLQKQKGQTGVETLTSSSSSLSKLNAFTKSQPSPFNIYQVSRTSNNQMKELKLFDVPKHSQLYSNFLPLHQLWEEYIVSLISPILKKESLWTQKLLKADLHGAILKVVRSSNCTQVGISGICIQDTQHLFKLITVDNIIKKIPKVNTVFLLFLPASLSSTSTPQSGSKAPSSVAPSGNGQDLKCVTLFGNEFRTKAADRIVKKYKPKPTVAF